MSSHTGGILRTFPRSFWIANVMELFERGAYYGMNSVLAIYLSDSIDEGGLGFSEQSIGFLQGLIYALTYKVFRYLHGNIFGLTARTARDKAFVSVYHSVPAGVSLAQAQAITARRF